jgi:hypothetical protein
MYRVRSLSLEHGPECEDHAPESRECEVGRYLHRSECTILAGSGDGRDGSDSGGRNSKVAAALFQCLIGQLCESNLHGIGLVDRVHIFLVA